VAKIGEARRLNEYESLACRMGQYDYSGQAPYYPKQDIVDKRQWKDDAFYGWRRELNRTEHRSAPPPMDGNRAVEEDESNESWRKDPFHNWLHHDATGKIQESPGPEGNVEVVQEARAARQLMSLPSFRDTPATRFEDNREYSIVAATAPRQRLGGKAPSPADTRPEQRWKDDAFFGWLPGRGHAEEQQHKLRRPLEQARLARLPSFAEGAPELAGVTGRGIGILTVWVLAATDLEYNHGSGLRGSPSACVQVSINGNSSVKATDTIARDDNPRWNSPPMQLEIYSIADVLQLEVQDLANPRGEEHLHHFFLGSVQLPIQRIQEKTARSNSARPLQFRETLEGSQRQSQLDFECLYEPYDTDDSLADAISMGASRSFGQDQLGVTRAPGQARSQLGRSQQSMSQELGRSQQSMSQQLGRPAQQPTRGASQRAPFGSNRSFAESELGQFGMLSIRIIAAYDLVNTDSGQYGDVSDPYVSMRLESMDEKQRKRTHTINNDLNPQWNSSPFLLPIAREDDALILEVWDEDMMKSDDFLGRLKVPLYRIINGEPNKPYRIKDKLQDIDSGVLEVEIGFSPG